MGGPNDTPTSTAPANLAQASTSLPNFDHIPGHAIEDPSTIGPATQSDPTTMHRLAPGQSAPASDPLSFHPIDKLNQLTEPIENYTQEGRAAHPILSRIGDVTRGAKELLEGGEAAGKPMGTSAGVADEATALLTAVDAAKAGATAEELAAKYGPKLAAHAMETIGNFTTEARAGIARAMEAKAPVGSAEAGAVKIPAKKSPPSFDHIAGHEEIAPAKKYAYRSRDVGEKGVPSASPAQATTSEDEARSIMGHREQITGQPQELVKIPLHTLDPEDFTAKPGPNGADWIKLHRDLGEHEIEPHGETATPETAEPEEGDTSFNFGANEKPIEVPEATKNQFGPDDKAGAEEHARVEQGKGIHPKEETSPEESVSTSVETHQNNETDDPYAISNGSSIITPGGKFVHGVENHENPGTIKTKVNFKDGQHSIDIDVPKGGITKEQVTALKAGAKKAVGKGGNVTIKSGDQTSKKEGASADHIEQMLTEVGAHPDGDYSGRYSDSEK